MTCFRPWTAYRGLEGGITGNPKRGYVDRTLRLPCGNCVGCRLARSSEWSVRIGHEASLHEANSFLTLTYSDENLPSDFSVSVRELQLFMKRVRNAGHTVRFFGCGEYGEETLRPHYHVIIFGYDFPDKTIWRRTDAGYYTYVSKELQRLWPFGHSEIGTVQKESAGYVARYVMKKVTGEAAAEHYRRIHPFTGEEVSVSPEFITMSTRPGIGAEWYTRYARDAFPSDFVIVDGEKRPVPRYYAKKLSLTITPQLLQPIDKIKLKRADNAKKRAKDNTAERLATRAEVTRLRVLRLKREIK